MHVRISRNGHLVLGNKVLASKIADAIISHKVELEKGEPIKIGGAQVKLVTTIKENEECSVNETKQEKIK